MTTGDDYLETITARDADRAARTAFCELAMSFAKQGADIFDFGAGPGIDAKFYAEHGYQVFAYDVDARMCDALLSYCREQVARRQVTLYEASHQDFIAPAPAAAAMRVDLITANFAPLSLIAELQPIFAKFHAITHAHGKVLISVLNPYFVGDMRYGWWWKNGLRLLLSGEYSVPGGSGSIFRRSPRRFRLAAAPYFALRAVLRGLPGELYRRWPLRRPALASSQFMFLLFERCP